MQKPTSSRRGRAGRRRDNGGAVGAQRDRDEEDRADRHRERNGAIPALARRSGRNRSSSFSATALPATADDDIGRFLGLIVDGLVLSASVGAEVELEPLLNLIVA